MFIDLTADQRALQQELRDYFEQLMKSFPDVASEMGEGMSASTKAVALQLGKDGWLGVGWPKEWGGHGKGATEQLIFMEEAAKAGCPLPFITLNTVGPTLMQFGTDEQKDMFIPRILAGDLEVAVGYSEPQAGTDLAALRTKAVRDGDVYVVNGQKIWTSGAHHADYIWLAVRTDPDAPKHKGISLLMCDTSLEGFRSSPIGMLMGGHTNATYYDDVRVPASMLIGEENQGWKLFTSQINRERIALGPSAKLAQELREVVAWARITEAAEGGVIADREWVSMSIARLHAKIEAARLFNWRMAWLEESGGAGHADASVMKVYGTELAVEVRGALLEIIGAAGTLQRGSAGAVLQGKIEQSYRSALVLTFGGGTNEIQREIIAMAGLGTPRVAR